MSNLEEAIMKHYEGSAKEEGNEKEKDKERRESIAAEMDAMNGIHKN